MITCRFSTREKLTTHSPAHLATLADSIYVLSLSSHLVFLPPLLLRFHFSAGKALSGAESARVSLALIALL